MVPLRQARRSRQACNANLHQSRQQVMNHQDPIAAVLTVGEGRGFVVKTDKQRLVITAAHCLPYFPRCASISQLEDRTYQALLGRIGEAPAVWAECLFADPIGDIAVLGPPDNQALSQEWDAYSALTGSTAPLIVADVPNEGTGWMLSLDGQWFKCDVRHEDARCGFSTLPRTLRAVCRVHRLSMTNVRR